MPICIECRYPVPQLYHVLHSTSKSQTQSQIRSQSQSRRSSIANSSASSFHQRRESGGHAGVSNVKSRIAIDGKTEGGGTAGREGDRRGFGEGSKGKGVAGGDVRLTQCPRCKRFADKYVEHDFVVLFIDLVLVKPQVYRHLLFNRLGREDDELDPSITRLGILLLLFNVYLTWSSIESLPPTQTSSSPIPHLPILLQYAFYLLLCSLTTLAQHLTVRTLASRPLFRASSVGSSPFPITASTTSASTSSSTASAGPMHQDPTPETRLLPSHHRPNAISTALFVSSCMKLFPILMVVWRYDDVAGQVGTGVEWAVAVQNLEALRILLGCSYLAAAVLVAGGRAAGWVVGRVVLAGVGLGAGAGVVG